MKTWKDYIDKFDELKYSFELLNKQFKYGRYKKEKYDKYQKSVELYEKCLSLIEWIFDDGFFLNDDIVGKEHYIEKDNIEDYIVYLLSYYTGFKGRWSLSILNMYMNTFINIEEMKLDELNMKRYYYCFDIIKSIYEGNDMKALIEKKSEFNKAIWFYVKKQSKKITTY